MASKENSAKKGVGSHPVASFIATAFFVIICVFIAFPLVAGLLASFRPGRELVQNGLAINFDFSTMTLDNYKYLFGLAGGNSSVDSAKYFMLVIATMCVPFEILMLPLYQEVTALGIINTRAGVILPGLCAASTIFFFRQYMQALPKELLDAARIDGCTEYGISVRIMMPITKPAFASMAILCAMGSWNNMLWPMLVFRDTNKFTLQIGLNTLLTPYGNNSDLLLAGSMFGIIPILLIYLIFQKYLIDGMTAGAVKG